MEDRTKGKSVRIAIRYKEHEIKLVDKKRRKKRRSDFIREKSLQ